MFYSIYFVLLAAALSAAVVGLGKLWEFLQHYEACQIYHTIDAVAAGLNSGFSTLQRPRMIRGRRFCEPFSFPLTPGRECRTMAAQGGPPCPNCPKWKL